MRRLVGYARVSTGEQDFQPQLDALRPVGCSDANIYTDKASGVRGNRPGLHACVKAFRHSHRRHYGDHQSLGLFGPSNQVIG